MPNRTYTEQDHLERLAHIHLLTFLKIIILLAPGFARFEFETQIKCTWNRSIKDLQHISCVGYVSILADGAQTSNQHRLDFYMTHLVVHLRNLSLYVT